MNNNQISFISLGGIGDVTKNMYLYEYEDEILIVDCGFGFADETMPGVDLLIPDVSYLKKTNKKIVGMVLTHGHEDHIGALPYILPQLPPFPIFGSTLTGALVNEKLSEAKINTRVQTVNFDQTLRLGNFGVSFIRVTHSIIDAAHILIKTPVGNFYHGSDFKFDFTPVDGKPSELSKIAKAGIEGITCLFSDSLGSERPGHSPSERAIMQSFEEEFRKAKGKIFVTTYSSNISRLNQAIEVGIKMNRKICFVGRSLLKSRDIGRQLNYIKYPKSLDITPRDVKKFSPSQVLILVAGSQGQEDSALVRIANREVKDIRMAKDDLVIFSADPIPGNETSIYSLIDTIAKQGARVIYSGITDEFHVSGHGSQNDLKLLIDLVKPKFLLPIGGTYRQMVAYRSLAEEVGFNEDRVILTDTGQEIKFSRDRFSLGRKIPLSSVFVDEVTGEAIENHILFDRVRIAREGLVIVIVEVDSNTGRFVSIPEILTKGFKYDDTKNLAGRINVSLTQSLKKTEEKVTNWIYYKKIIERVTEGILLREGRQPLVVPVVLEV
ncbi:ribonuclease J [Patescibacteria group bacterium]|nr:ribonuclease J [Patescibacteria group bacterium]